MAKSTLEYFYDICKIPRESGNEKAISNFIVNFAKERDLKYIQDNLGNVIIKKYSGNTDTIIFQSHLDMVCQKNNDEFDFEKDPIQTYIDGEYLKAKGTTLGADNGVGVAQMLRILDLDLKCNIECVFTVFEETTMEGAQKIDVSSLNGKWLISFDGFEEKSIIIESAGFADIHFYSNYKFNKNLNNDFYEIELKGLSGGHSGFDIDSCRGNSLIILARLLKEIKEINLADFYGGKQQNVIPSASRCIFSSELSFDEIKLILDKFKNSLIKKFKNIELTLSRYNKNEEILTNEDSLKFLDSIVNLPDGVFFKDENGYIESSSNLGKVSLKDGIFLVGMRNSKKEYYNRIIKNYNYFAKEYGYRFEIFGEQQGFQTQKDCQLVKKLLYSYKEVNNNNIPRIKPVHITVEAGIFESKIKGLQAVIISPEILDAHSVNERVKIQSIIDMDNWIIHFLKNL